MTKIIEWIEIQVGKFMIFLDSAKVDLQEFDEKAQQKIQEYNNKQCAERRFSVPLSELSSA